MSLISVPVSFGELLDKIAILQIKTERMSDPAKVANVRRELEALEASWGDHAASHTDIAALRAQLKAVNERLWVIEDDIRICEKNRDFGTEFVRLARAVYFENDERARIKRDINRALGSQLVEEKSYEDYRAGPSV
jgi:phage host-nuclease inhibitor protein Gam